MLGHLIWDAKVCARKEDFSLPIHLQLIRPTQPHVCLTAIQKERRRGVYSVPSKEFGAAVGAELRSLDRLGAALWAEARCGGGSRSSRSRSRGRGRSRGGGGILGTIGSVALLFDSVGVRRSGGGADGDVRDHREDCKTSVRKDILKGCLSVCVKEIM